MRYNIFLRSYLGWSENSWFYLWSFFWSAVVLLRRLEPTWLLQKCRETAWVKVGGKVVRWNRWKKWKMLKKGRKEWEHRGGLALGKGRGGKWGRKRRRMKWEGQRGNKVSLLCTVGRNKASLIRRGRRSRNLQDKFWRKKGRNKYFRDSLQIKNKKLRKTAQRKQGDRRVSQQKMEKNKRWRIRKKYKRNKSLKSRKLKRMWPLTVKRKCLRRWYKLKTTQFKRSR